MELQEFIKNTLVSIQNGVADANKATERDHFSLANESRSEGYVMFDAAVTIGTEAGKTGGGGLKIAILNIGGEKSDKTIQESVSRIKFYVKIQQKIS